MQLDHIGSARPANQSDSKKIKKIGPALAAATCSVLGLGVAPALAQGEPESWDFDLATLYYAESDNRVTAIEPVFSATKNFAEGETLNLKAVFDSLTGASPNGATPSDVVQTFTKPSGNSTYRAEAGETPLDDTFMDTRVALSANWRAPIDREWEYTAGAYVSGEYDYFSVGSNGAIKRYLNGKNTALNAGLSVSFDTIKPEGDLPIGLSEMPIPGSINETAVRNASRDGATDTKNIVDMLFGVTQIINRQTIMQFNYSMSWSDGYLNDPFKVLSVIDTDPLGANYGGNLSNAEGNIYLYEARPDSRMKHSLYWQAKYALENGDVIDGSYRFMLDDWGIHSHTFDFRYRWDMGDSYLEPHVRYYLQSEADFYHRYIGSDVYNGGSPTIKEASADERLGEMDAMTLGLKYGMKMSNGHEVNMRVEYYLQSHSGEAGIGKLASQELYPDSDAIIFQVGYSF